MTDTASQNSDGHLPSTQPPAKSGGSGCSCSNRVWGIVLLLLAVAFYCSYQPFFTYLYPIENDARLITVLAAGLAGFCGLMLLWWSRQPQMKKNLLLFAGMMIFCFVLLEVFCRIWIWGLNGLNLPWMANLHEYTYNACLQQVKDADLPFENRPGFHHRYSNATVDINAEGLRDQGYPLVKPPHTVRVAVLGDSFTFGLGVEQKDLYPTVLEALGNAANDGRHYEFINFGVISYGLDHYLAVLRKKALSYSPDLVIVGFCSNDVQLPEISIGKESQSKLLYSYHYFHALKSYTIQLVKRTLYPLVVKNRYYDVNSDAKRAYLDRMFEPFGQFSAETGVPVVFYYLAHYPVDVEGVQRIARARQVKFYDLSGEFAGRNSMDYCISRVDPHPNALANRIYAVAIYRNLKENHWFGVETAGRQP